MNDEGKSDLDVRLFTNKIEMLVPGTPGPPSANWLLSQLSLLAVAEINEKVNVER